MDRREAGAAAHDARGAPGAPPRRAGRAEPHRDPPRPAGGNTGQYERTVQQREHTTGAHRRDVSHSPDYQSQFSPESGSLGAAFPAGKCCSSHKGPLQVLLQVLLPKSWWTSNSCFRCGTLHSVCIATESGLN